jgi:PPP family 3-phenylpropionic acid transporter
VSISPRVALPIIYAFGYGIYGALLPFLPVILHDQGLSDSEVALALSATGVAGILSPLLVAHFADSVLPLRRLLCALFLSAALLTPFWLQVTSLLSAFLVTLAIFSLLMPALASLDTFTIDLAKRSEEDSSHPKVTFQGVRTWGSAGFLVPTILLLAAGIQSDLSTEVLVILGTVLAALSGCIALILPHNQPVKSGTAKPSKEALRQAWTPPIRIIFIAGGIAGVALSMFFAVFPRYLQELGAETTTIGVTSAIGVLFEILLIPFTGRLIRRFGAKSVLLFGIAALPTRTLLLAAYPSLPLAICLQFLHAPVVVGMMVSVPILLHQVGGRTFRFSLQGLYTVITIGVARTLGPFLISPILAWYSDTPLLGLRVSLLLCGILGVSAAVVLGSAEITRKSRERTTQKMAA